MNYSGGSRGGDLPPPPTQSAVRKKMAALHFTTIPFETNTASYTYKVKLCGGGGGEQNSSL